jgi:hypothetical protein
MKSSRLVGLTLAAMLAGVATPAVATAQGAPARSEPIAAPVGPIAAPVGISRVNVLPSSEATNLQDTMTDRDVSWMIVGGAALLVGSMVEGDAGTLLMVGGAVIGLTGLFRYLR